MTNKIRVLILNEPAPVNAITWYRMYRPLTLLARDYPDIEITWNRGHVLPSDLMNADVVVAMHVSNFNQVAVIEAAKNQGCRVILDFDDDVLNIPISHGVWANLCNAGPAVKRAVELADMVWVSTAALGESLKAKNWIVVPNAVLPEDLPEAPNPITGRMVWRGSVMSFFDLWNRQHQFLTYMEKTSEFVWYGYQPPYFIPAATAQKVGFLPWMDFGGYFQQMRNLKPNVIWKPLENILFNAAKSNIAWIEATCAGAVCLTDAWRVKNGMAWEYCLQNLTYDRDTIGVLWEQSKIEILKAYNLKKINQIRYDSLVGTLQTSI